MILLYSRSWSGLLVRGLAAIAFGVLSLIWPELSLQVLVILLGAYFLLDGIVSVVAAVRWRKSHEAWWLLLLDGVFGIAFGIVAFAWPGITALALLFLLAAWAILTGILEIVAAVRLRKVLEGEWLLGLSGVLSVLFGVGIALFPGAGALALIAFIAAFAILYGVLLTALALKVRKLRKWAEEQFSSVLVEG